MARMKLGAMLRKNIYAFVYGREGVGKTNLIMSLAHKSDGSDIAIITPESSGPTSILSRGFSGDIAVELLPPSGHDPFEPCIKAIESFTRDPSISGICVDGLTVMCGRGIDFLSDGQGEKAMGYDGWGQLLNGFRMVEAAAEKASRAGKSVLFTAWENPPQYEDTMGGQSVKALGRPLLQGKAQTWMPGNCDVVARMTSKFTKEVVNGKAMPVFKASLQVNANAEWFAKTRWLLPDPCPADLKYILQQVQSQSGGKVSAPVLKKVVAK